MAVRGMPLRDDLLRCEQRSLDLCHSRDLHDEPAASRGDPCGHMGVHAHIDAVADTLKGIGALHSSAADEDCLIRRRTGRILAAHYGFGGCDTWTTRLLSD